MTFKASVKTCFRKFATFQGRASRSEYWWFFLFMLIVIYLPLFAAGFAEGAGETTIAIAIYVVSMVLAVILILPSLSVTCRRLHDRDRSGWVLLAVGLLSGLLNGASKSAGEPIFFEILSCIPQRYLIIECMLTGTKGINKYGADPIAKYYCPSCHAERSEFDSFCRKCGLPFVMK